MPSCPYLVKYLVSKIHLTLFYENLYFPLTIYNIQNLCNQAMYDNYQYQLKRLILYLYKNLSISLNDVS